MQSKKMIVFIPVSAGVIIKNISARSDTVVVPKCYATSLWLLKSFVNTKSCEHRERSWISNKYFFCPSGPVYLIIAVGASKGISSNLLRRIERSCTSG